MATFTNRATLSYSGGSVDSNTVTGEILEALAVQKNAVMDDYTAMDDVTYVIVLRNTGAVALTNLTITDDLGAYTQGTETRYPLAYTVGSMNYYVNGALQPAPAVTAGPPMVIQGISVPAGGTVMLIYEASVTRYAPLGAAATITNTATVTGNGVTAPLTAAETISTEDRADLTISKSVCPAIVTENGQLTYTFVIENTGNTPAAAGDNVVVTDTFDPRLTGINVTFNGTTWTENVNYTYNPTTGEFATVAGQITVPAAVYTQQADGTWTVTPGASTLVVTGQV
mgnify:CR=1 FL=1